jgi:adenylosuccinate synthase
MQEGKLNIILDCFWGSSGKGKTSAWLADHFSVEHVSSSNFPNAGHTAAFADGTKFIAKAIPTAAILRKIKGVGMKCWISPGSGFAWEQLMKEWVASGKPEINIHSRASIVTRDHKQRESEGSESTKHIASTMQGSATAMVDKILRKENCVLANTTDLGKVLGSTYASDPAIYDLFGGENPQTVQDLMQEFLERVHVIDAWDFRKLTHRAIESGHAWLHEGSQGYALSIDHGSQYPNCTSRNCSVQAAMDHMAVPPKMVGDVYLNLRTYPIRVGNVVEEGVQKGYSGDFYPDCQELTWEQVAANSGMPEAEAKSLAERERTTVTKRIRRVCTFSYEGLRDAVKVNGATKLVLNFMQYISWSDYQVRDFEKLSAKSRHFIDSVEEAAGVPVVLIGTGALHDDMISRL